MLLDYIHPSMLVYLLLIQSSRPTTSGPLEERLRKAKSSDVAQHINSDSLKNKSQYQILIIEMVLKRFGVLKIT
jgi:hypothetical protein